MSQPAASPPPAASGSAAVAANADASVEVARVSGAALSRDDPPRDDGSDHRPGEVGRPVRAAAAMVGALLVGASFALAVSGTHVARLPAPAPQVATFHSGDRDMNRFWHPG